MDWKVFFKKVAIFSWCMAIISVLIYIVRYTASEIGNLFMWNQPFIWELIFGLVFCLLSVFWLKKINLYISYIYEPRN